MSSSAWDAPGAPDLGGKNNPWSTDAFNPPTPHVRAPGPSKRTPRNIPDRHELFVVQRHALDVLHGLRDLEHTLGEHAHDHKVRAELHSLQRDAENTYRVIRTWLQNHLSDEATTLA